MSFLHDDELNAGHIKRERLVSALFFSCVSAFFVFDILDDLFEGVSLYHIGFEIVLGVIGLGFAIYLFAQYARARGVALRKTRAELFEAKRVAAEWQKQARSFREGLTNAISHQLDKWEMTSAEKEICFLLLKGFSLQEIADIRKSSERTVRQQASVIYKKSGLSGRIQLSAFFLEDLLSPSG